MSPIDSLYTAYNLIGYKPGYDLFYAFPSAGNGVFHVANSAIYNVETPLPRLINALEHAL